VQGTCLRRRSDKKDNTRKQAGTEEIAKDENGVRQMGEKAGTVRRFDVPGFKRETWIGQNQRHISLMQRFEKFVGAGGIAKYSKR